MFFSKKRIFKHKFWFKNFYITKLLLFVLFVFIFSGCGRQEPLNLSIAKERVEHYYESGQYDRDLIKTTNRALKHFKHVSPDNKATVIFDVDDTALSDYADDKSISFGFIPKLSHEWIIRANAPAIPEIKCLYDYLIKQGFIIIFLTGRKYDEYDATIKNLKSQGFTQFEKLIVRQRSEVMLTAQEYKIMHRRQLIKEGYRIVGSVGDQWSDLTGDYTGYKVKLPNVRYRIL